MEPSKFFAYFGYAMALFFAVTGLFVIFLLPLEFKMPEKFRFIIGFFLLAYGAYRFMSIRIKQRQKEDEENQHT